MAETSVPRTQDTTGTLDQIDVYSLPDGKKQEAVVLGDGATNGRTARVGAGGDLSVSITSPNAAAAGIFAQLNAYGSQRVSVEPTTLFSDPFDSVVETVRRWTTGGTAPTISAGMALVAPGTGASASSRLTSKPSFFSPGLGFIIWAGVVQVDAAAVANTYRAWGWGTEGGSPAYQAPGATTSTIHGNFVGFELDGAGAMYAVVYAAGALTYRSAAITSSLYSGGTQHRYAIFRRADILFWYVEGQDIPVASVAYQGGTVQALPIRVVSFNNSVAPSTAPTLAVEALTVCDSTAQNQTLSDPDFPWLRAGVDPNGILKAGQPCLQFEVTASPRATAVAVAMGDIVPAGVAMPELGWAEVTVVNNTTTALNGAASNGTPFTLQFTDTIGGVLVTMPVTANGDPTTYGQYLTPGGSIAASGGIGRQAIRLTAGALRTLVVNLLAGTAPTTGTVTIRVTLHPQPAGVAFVDTNTGGSGRVVTDNQTNAANTNGFLVKGRTPSTPVKTTGLEIAHDLQTDANGVLAGWGSPAALTSGVGAMQISRGRVVVVTGTAAVSSSAQLIAAPAAGLSIYVTDINVTNQGTAAQLVSLTDGIGVALAAAIFDRYAPATQSAPAVMLRTPLKLTAATALGYLTSAAQAGTSPASLYIDIGFYVAP